MRKSAYPAPCKRPEEAQPPPSKAQTPPPFRRSMPIWGQALVYVIPCVFISVAIWAGLNDSRFERGALRAEAEVLSIRTETVGGTKNARGEYTSNTGRAIYPTVRFTAADGETYTIETETNRGGLAIQDQDWIVIAYHPEDPTRVRIARSPWDTWKQPLAIIAPCGLMILGLAFLFRHITGRDRARYRKRWGIAP